MLRGLRMWSTGTFRLIAGERIIRNWFGFLDGAALEIILDLRREPTFAATAQSPTFLLLVLVLDVLSGGGLGTGSERGRGGSGGRGSGGGGPAPCRPRGAA